VVVAVDRDPVLVEQPLQLTISDGAKQLALLSISTTRPSLRPRPDLAGVHLGEHLTPFPAGFGGRPKTWLRDLDALVGQRIAAERYLKYQPSRPSWYTPWVSLAPGHLRENAPEYRHPVLTVLRRFSQGLGGSIFRPTPPLTALSLARWEGFEPPTF
jgi:hypothetical protein